MINDVDGVVSNFTFRGKTDQFEYSFEKKNSSNM